MLVEPDNDRVLGFTMLGADAGEVIAVVQTAIFTHPTMAEGLNVLLATTPV